MSADEASMLKMQLDLLKGENAELQVTKKSETHNKDRENVY